MDAYTTVVVANTTRTPCPCPFFTSLIKKNHHETTKKPEKPPFYSRHQEWLFKAIQRREKNTKRNYKARLRTFTTQGQTTLAPIGEGLRQNHQIPITREQRRGDVVHRIIPLVGHRWPHNTSMHTRTSCVRLTSVTSLVRKPVDAHRRCTRTHAQLVSAADAENNKIQHMMPAPCYTRGQKLS